MMFVMFVPSSPKLTTKNVLSSGKEQCINWHRSKQISVEIHSEMICAGHSDGHQDACLGNLLKYVLHSSTSFRLKMGHATPQQNPGHVLGENWTKQLRFRLLAGSSLSGCHLLEIT